MRKLRRDLVRLCELKDRTHPELCMVELVLNAEEVDSHDIPAYCTPYVIFYPANHYFRDSEGEHQICK